MGNIKIGVLEIDGEELDTPTEYDLASALQYVGIPNPQDVYDLTSEPTGYADRTKSTLSFDEGTRTLSIAPVSGSFDVYVAGKKITISSTLTKQIPNTSGSYFFFITSAGVLDYQQTFSVSILTSVAYTAYVLWDATNSKAVSFGEERHGLVMDGATHGYLHTTRGTQLVSGASIGYTITDSGSLDADAQVSISDLSVRDEDILVQITNSASPTLPFQQKLSPIAYLPIYYRVGTTWTKDTGTAFPMKTGTVRARFNQNNSGTWSLVEATKDRNYLVSYVFATTNIQEPVIVLLGQDEYTSLSDAQARAAWSKVDFGDLPAQEMKLLYIIMYQTSSTYTNTPKCLIGYISDLRFGADREVSATSFNTAHSNLSGLGNDDHLQYLLVNGSRAMSSSLDMGTNNITNVGTVNSVTVENHKARHQPGGADAIPTASAVSIALNNSEGVSTSLARADHTHKIDTGTITNDMLASGIDAAKIDGGGVTNTEFSYLANVTSDIQTQINGKQAAGNYITALTGDVTATGPGSVTATLSNTGVIAGTYDSLTVDTKGRITSATLNRYKYVLGAQATNNTAAYSTVAGLTSVSLPVGIYRFKFLGLMQSTQAASGVGVRIINGTATLSTVYGKWSISQGADGVSQAFIYDQTSTSTNVTSASVNTLNSNFVVMGDGVFRVTVAGTVAIQIRPEVGGQTATLQADAMFEIMAL